jgi:putative transposase
MENKKYNATIGDAMDWFKTMTTNEYIRGVRQSGWKRFNGKLWQRNYWEHIIRSTAEYERISSYIIANPAKWRRDKLFN